MTISSIGAFALGEYPEAVAVMWLYQIGEFLQDMAVDKSRGSIESLMDIRPDFARIVKGKKTQKTDPQNVEVGQTIQVRPGEKIPLDGTVLSGTSTIDASALTGESMPVAVGKNSQVLSGTINLEGVLTVKVTKTADASTAAKVLELVENAANKKSRSENFISKFAKIYTPIVCLLAVLVCVIPSLATGQ